MVRTTASKGIVQSDILIRTAVMKALDNLRANPWQLDFAFAWAPQDDLSEQEYGDKELQAAKDWFLNTDINVTMAYRNDDPALPAIGIELLESSEAEATIGDVHYEPSESIDASDVVIKTIVLGPFTPKAYDSATGSVTLPDSLSTDSLFVGNILFDAQSSTGFPIIEVTGASTFRIQAGVKVDFTRAYVAPREAFYTVELESLLFKESYRIRCYAPGNVTNLFYLHTVLAYALLAYKEQYLEGRGFDRSTMTSQNVGKYEGPAAPENIWQRDITLTGYVRQYWARPGSLKPKIDGIAVAPIKVIGGGKSPARVLQQVADQGWSMEEDDEDQLAALRRR